MISAATILKLTKQLYPSGRGFKMPMGGDLEKLHNGLAVSEAQAYSDALSILDSALPDNNNFTADDATLWETRLGLITNPAVSLSDRKAALLRKMSHPGTIKPRQNFRYIQSQLRFAGFDVYVYENRFPDGFGGYVTQSPLAVSGGIGGVPNTHGPLFHGSSRHGSKYENIVANYIDERTDWAFNIGTNLRSTFFIGGDPIGSFADVDVNRKDEFRQTILRLKPAHTVAFLLVNYI